MFLLKRTSYFITLMLLSACQSVDTRDPNVSEQNLKTHSLSTISLLSNIQKKEALVLTDDDERHAQSVLELNYTKQPSTWLAGHNKDISLTIVPVRTYKENGDIHCREYLVKITQKQGPETSGTACRYGVNQWKVISKKVGTAIKPEHSNSEVVLDAEEIIITAPAVLDPTAKMILEEEISKPVVTTPTTTKRNEVEQYFLALSEKEKGVAKKADPVAQERVENTSASRWIIQVASFSEKDNAVRLVTRLEKQGYEPYTVEILNNGRMIYRVKIDVEGGQDLAEDKVDELKKQFGFSPLLTRQ